MSVGFFEVPKPKNEPNLSYAPGNPERKTLQEEVKKCYGEVVEIPMVINGKDVKTGNTVDIFPPHKLKHKVGFYHKGEDKHVHEAIETALKAREKWASMPWENRLAIFLKAADLLAGPYRAKLNAATMIGQSKNPFQAEIDSAAELIDFWRFNAYFATQIYKDQPENAQDIWNRNEFRPLEGFIFAVTPFNFTSIAGNLPTAPAMMGNVVVWKPSNKQIYSAKVLMDIWREAGLPDGVINMIFTNAPRTSEIVLNHPEFSGLHFTGSTAVLNSIFKKVGENIANYRTYPRIVGETGGKDFVVIHESANMAAAATALARGAFEFQGQKCSAASRAYIPTTNWDEIKKTLFEQVKSFKMGDPEDFSNFINAVIDENAFKKHKGYIDRAKESPDAEIVLGGNYDDSEGYFVEPTIILAKKPDYESMEEEIFGPILTIYLYEPDKFEETLDLVDQTSPYALTGAIFSTDRHAVQMASEKLVNAAGNFYINDKPTGAVVGQQPFGGARASGTNDKAGSYLNLTRWISMRTIKENFVPPTDYRYPFLG